MAASKKSYKKSTDRTLTYIIVGFGVIIVSLIIGLMTYNAFNPTYDYGDFDRLYSYYDIPNQDDEGTYLVYFYGESCSHCQDIKTDFLHFAATNDAGIKVYVIESGYSTGWPVNTDTGYNQYGTPTLFTVRNNVIVDVSPGTISIEQVVEEIESGTYEFMD